MSASRLFIGNLPYLITNDELDVVLAEAGHRASDINVVKDRETGQGRGFAFAEFGSVAAAEHAKNSLQGMLVQGRPLRVDYATSTARPNNGGGPRPSMPRHDDWSNKPSGEKGNSKKGRRERDRGNRW